jgi:hypothetical protein
MYKGDVGHVEKILDGPRRAGFEWSIRSTKYVTIGWVIPFREGGNIMLRLA